MATGLSWMSDYPASVEITIISILFIVVYITLYSLCTNCFSRSPETPCYPVEKESSSSFSTKKPEDQWSKNRTSGNEHASISIPQNSAPPVPDRPPTRSYTMVQTQTPKAYSHNRAESHRYFSQGMMPQLQDAPVFPFESEGSMCPMILDSPIFPSMFHWPRALDEQATNSPQQSQQSFTIGQKGNETPDGEDQPNAKTNSMPWQEISEEHLYESIGIAPVSDPSPSHEAAKDESDSENPYEAVREPKDPAAGHSTPSLTMTDSGLAETPQLPLPAVKDRQGLNGTETTDIYAAVNLKNKSLKLKEIPLPPVTTEQDEDDVHEEVAPPVPEKMFE